MSLNKKLPFFPQAREKCSRAEKKAEVCGKEVNVVSRGFPVLVCQSNLALACRMVLPRILLILLDSHSKGDSSKEPIP